MTALVLSFILILLTVTINRSGFFTRSAVLDAEYKERSRALAEACANIAMLYLAANPVYTGSSTVPISGNTCFIRPVQFDVPAVGQNTIETHAVFQEAITNLHITVSSTSFTILSWAEVPHF